MSLFSQRSGWGYPSLLSSYSPWLIPAPPAHAFLLQALPSLYLSLCPSCASCSHGTVQSETEKQARAGRTDKEDWVHTGLQANWAQVALEV